MQRAPRRIVVFLLLASLSGALPAGAEEKADALGHELIAALGGEAAWEKARQFQFDFVVESEGKAVARFSHLWDRHTGDYRLAGTDKTDAPYAVYFNVKTRQGQVFVNGRPVEGAPRAAQLESAYERYVNDTYWLIAPWKIFDVGVRRAYDGEKPCPDAGTCDVLKLTFDESSGLASGDTYWLSIAREGRRVIQWQYLVGGAAEAPTTAAWMDWQKFDGILLSLWRPIARKAVSIRFENVTVAAGRDDSLFRPPAVP